jgi:hypothetical protein
MRRTEIPPANAEKVVDILGQEIDRLAARITAEASWARLEAFFYEALKERKSIDAAVMVTWAEAGHPAADRAIKRYYAEMVDQGRDLEVLQQIRVYIVRTLLDPFVPYPRGRHVVQNLMRDLWLPCLMQRVAEGTGLPVTRSAASAAPSVAYFVSLAMKRKGIKLKERQLNRIYWERHKVAGALEASMPAIPLKAA